MSGLHPVDLCVLVGYLIGITVLGAWMGSKVTGMSDYFMPRRFGKMTMIMHAFGTGTASDQAVTVASATMKYGLSGVWFQWMWLFSTPFYWLIAPIMRRFRAVTTADVYELRYDRSVSMLFSLLGMAGMSVKIGVLLLGAGKLIDSGTGGLVDVNWAIPIITVLFVCYGMAGGLGGAIVTDFVQGVMTIIFSFMLLPVILSEVGGISGICTTILASPDGAELLSLVAPGHINAFYIAMLSINMLFLIVALPSVMGNCAAGKTEMDGRIGFMFGTFIKRVCTIAWCLTAMGAMAWYLQNGIDITQVDPDSVYGNVAHEFLPQLMPGILGLFIASLLAAVMSSCDSFMIASAALFTENIYRVWQPKKSQTHYIWIGRITSLLIVAGGIVFAYMVDDVVAGLKVWYKVVPMMGIAFWLGLFWRRTTVAGAWAATLAGFGTWWLVNQSFAVEYLQTLSVSLPEGLLITKNEITTINEPWQILLYLSAGTAVGVFVSLITPRVNEDRLNLFYALTRTPVQPGEEIEQPCTLPAGVTPPPRRMLVNFAGLEIPAPSTTSWIGFAAGWVCVVSLIYGFILLMNL